MRTQHSMMRLFAALLLLAGCDTSVTNPGLTPDAAFHAGRLIDPLELAVAQVEAETVPMEERQQLTLWLEKIVRSLGREAAFRFDRSQGFARTLEAGRFEEGEKAFVSRQVLSQIGASSAVANADGGEIMG